MSVANHAMAGWVFVIGLSHVSGYEYAARRFLMLKIAGGGFMGHPVACYWVLKAGGIPI
jgi:hypothetical protein